MARPRTQTVKTDKDPLWYKNAIFYEVPVRAFFDSNADGIGDFRGLTQKLDYIQDLGVTAVWLLPFYPSPLKDDGYDIADYYSINPIYGTLADFKTFLREAHARGLRVITELVLNHTSDQHQLFQQARRAKPGSRERNFYVWSDTPQKYKDARIIFKDFEPSNWTWDPIAQSYYWHRFYSHQPDLNFESPHVHREIQKILEFWLDLGVDGFRLDAVPYLYEREGTSCENLPETHQYLKGLRAHLDQQYGGCMLLAEANQWPEEAVPYFGSGKGDECHMAFHFPLMPRLFMAVRMEDRVPVTDILDQTPAIPENCQWALFLRNHDELTLEMVTDEERDFMYRVYASDSKARLNLGIRRRLAPLLSNDRKRIELLNMLLLSLPGTPVIYYGDEIGMGDNIFLGDRNGVRTPMQWSADKNAGFSRATPQALYLPIILDPEYHYEAVNAEVEQRNLHSLLWWTRRVLALRKRWKVFGSGSLEFLRPENRKVLAFLRRSETGTVLVVANLSRFPQPVELDLARFRDCVPIELFGRTEFPPIGESPYLLTLSPHASLWFSVEASAARKKAADAAHFCKTLTATENWEEFVTGTQREEFESCLPAYFQQLRWFKDKGEIKAIRIRELVPMTLENEQHFLALLFVEFTQSEPEEYQLPIAFASGEMAERIQRESPHFILARARIESVALDGILYDATVGKDFAKMLFETISHKRALKGDNGSLVASASHELRAVRNEPAPEPVTARTEQRNTSVAYGDRFFLKLFRRVERGINSGLEIARFLAEKEFTHVPPLHGALEYQSDNGERACLGILSGFIPSAQDGWQFTQDALRRYYDRVRTLPREALATDSGQTSLVELAANPPSYAVREIIGTYIEPARLLGHRTGELHVALASDFENKDFAPEPFTPFYQRSLYQTFRNHLTHHFHLLRRDLKNLPDSVRAIAERALGLQDAIVARYRAVHQTPINAMRIRCHGNYHLGHVLHTGKDFFIIDLEGEPARSLSDRRIKRSPLRDVAGMIRSLNYAANSALRRQVETGGLHEEQFHALEPWAAFWQRWVTATFLNAYFDATRNSSFLPDTQPTLAILLDAFVLDKAITQMGFELANRLHWLHVPLQSILKIMEAPAAS
ncbi:MAG TPA: maltose alpha-D-glucosyltransferase [Verrucomicrobiae bacterium]|nr:maltose alpha-D-glucosyltransferase [Verrucomicrobiae bacterium]